VKEEESGRETCVCVSETGKVFVYGSKIVCLCFCICVCVCVCEIRQGNLWRRCVHKRKG
jgi:hypothetical protein